MKGRKKQQHNGETKLCPTCDRYLKLSSYYFKDGKPFDDCQGCHTKKVRVFLDKGHRKEESSVEWMGAGDTEYI